MATAAEINTKTDAAVSSIGSGDFATAILELMQVKAMLAAKPDQRHPGGGELSYDRGAIDDLIKQVRRQQHAGAGIQVQNVEKVSATNTP